MKLISFDVGIKNMAYCIFDLSFSQKTLSIQGWNILNLLEDEPVTEVCQQMNPGKTKRIPAKLCTTVAKYKKNGQCYCDKHAKKSSFLIPTKKNSLASIKKLKIEDLVKLGQSHLLFLQEDSVPKLKKDLVDKIGQFYEKECFEPIVKKKGKNAAELDLITIGKNMKELLNKVEGIDDISHVAIENQISPIANRMKTVQGMLAQYFIMKNSHISIDFVSSANKLNQFGEKKAKIKSEVKDQVKDQLKPLENTLVTDEKITVNPDYKKHKNDGLFYCKQILDQNHCFAGWNESLNIKKADDLADCFLQGIWYLKQKNIITCADDLKIIFV